MWRHIARDLLSLGHQDSRVGEVEKMPENKPSFLTGRGNATRLSLGMGVGVGVGVSTLQKEIRL